jgi:hypothetical protein
MLQGKSILAFRSVGGSTSALRSEPQTAIRFAFEAVFEWSYGTWHANLGLQQNCWKSWKTRVGSKPEIATTGLSVLHLTRSWDSVRISTGGLDQLYKKLLNVTSCLGALTVPATRKTNDDQVTQDHIVTGSENNTLQEIDFRRGKEAVVFQQSGM